MTPRTVAHQGSLSFTILQSLFKLMPVESVMLPNHLILCRPLFLLPSIFPSIKVFPVSWFSCKATQTQDSVSQAPGDRQRKLSGKGLSAHAGGSLLHLEPAQSHSSLEAPTSDQWWPHLQSLQRLPLPTPTPLILKKVQTTLNITGQKL